MVISMDLITLTTHLVVEALYPAFKYSNTQIEKFIISYVFI